MALIIALSFFFIFHVKFILTSLVPTFIFPSPLFCLQLHWRTYSLKRACFLHLLMFFCLECPLPHFILPRMYLSKAQSSLRCSLILWVEIIQCSHLLVCILCPLLSSFICMFRLIFQSVNSLKAESSGGFTSLSLLVDSAQLLHKVKGWEPWRSARFTPSLKPYTYILRIFKKCFFQVGGIRDPLSYPFLKEQLSNLSNFYKFRIFRL